MMRKFINAILLESTTGFVLDPALDPNNYVMTDTLKTVSKWRAMTYVGNNGDEHLGQLYNVGYVMISKSSNRIIPISHDDEHRMGMDLLYDLVSGRYPYGKKSRPLKIDPTDYVPIWPFGNNYIYEKSEIPDLVNVLGKFLSYGGLDGPLKGSSSMSGTFMHLSDFVERAGNVDITPGSLAPTGQKIITAFSDLANTIRSVGTDGDRISSKKAFTKATKVAKFITPISGDLEVDLSFLKSLPAKMKELQKANDLQGLEELFFGFHGLKNIIHTKLKKLVKGAKAGDNMSSFYLRRVTGLWGDVDLAIDMLGRL